MIRRGSDTADTPPPVNLAATSDTYRKEAPGRRSSIATTLAKYARRGPQEAELTRTASIRSQIHDDQIRTAARRVVVDDELWTKFQASVKETGSLTGMTLKQTYYDLLADRLAEAGSNDDKPARPRYPRSMSLHHLPMGGSTRALRATVPTPSVETMGRSRLERRKSVSLRGHFVSDCRPVPCLDYQDPNCTDDDEEKGGEEWSTSEPPALDRSFDSDDGTEKSPDTPSARRGSGDSTYTTSSDSDA